ncbi:MAG TPA: ABC transporter ATP-binding protein [Gemmatimonadaceae bacterium]|jgi:ABC-2 type transport system ATP-binding protein|nr:ABC transporter ATP-binding protein [Gemmatimonadaceae bacterium]
MSSAAAGRHDEQAVVAERLTKRFGEVVAVNDVSVSVGNNEIFGFIGPDGAGKTTLFRMLVTLLLPDSGSARVLGLDVVSQLWELRRHLGYMPGRFSLYPDLSVEENLRFFASVFGTTIEREYDHIAPIYSQLEPFKARRAAALSGGMKQKLALCCALVHRPQVLFLDEPTTGVDAVSRREFWELLAKLKATGLTIVVSTPYMDEARRCDRVALMQHGRLLAVDTPRAITESFGRPLYSVTTGHRYRALQILREFPQTASVYPFGESLHYTDRRTGQSPEGVASELHQFAAARGLADLAVRAMAPTIEDVFMARMGGSDGPETSEPRGAA